MPLLLERAAPGSEDGPRIVRPAFEDEIEHRTSDENPAHTSVRGRYTLTQELEDRTLVFEQKTLFKSDEKNFNLSITRTVLKDGELFEERSWDETIPRDHQ